MNWALRFVVPKESRSSSKSWTTHWLANKTCGERSGFYIQKCDGMRCKSDMTSVLKTCRNEKHSLLPNSFATMVRKAVDLAQCSIGEKFSTVDGCKIQNFRSYEEQLTETQIKTEIRSPVTHSYGQWAEIEVDNWVVCPDKFAETLWFSLSFFQECISLQKRRHSVHGSGIISTYQIYHEYIPHSQSKHSRSSVSTLKNIHYVRKENDISSNLKNCTKQKLPCVIFTFLKYTLICSLASFDVMRTLRIHHSQNHVVASSYNLAILVV